MQSMEMQQVRGYRRPDADKTQMLLDIVEDKMIQELIQRKDELLYELRSHEQNIKKMKEGKSDSDLIDRSTNVTCKLQPNMKGKCVDLVIATESQAVIKAAIVKADQLFDQESIMAHAREPSNTLRIRLAPEKDVSSEMTIQALIGHAMAYVF